MDFIQWSSKDPLVINKFGIPEPSNGKIKFPDVLLVPLLSFDTKLNRVGYGGGFYDRYIHRIKRKKKTAACWIGVLISRSKKYSNKQI